MTGRQDLDALHALAASISEEKHGWRSHRRSRSQAASRRRLEAEMVAPVKRKRRHRMMAVSAVAMIVAAVVALVATHRPGAPAPQQQRTAQSVAAAPSDVRAGEAAAVALHRLGRAANVFSCQDWYDSQHFAAVPAQRDPAWRKDYLDACAAGG